jgi:hypothetical protein
MAFHLEILITLEELPANPINHKGGPGYRQQQETLEPTKKEYTLMVP